MGCFFCSTKVHLFLEKKRTSSPFSLRKTNLAPVLGCVKGVCVPFGVPRFLGGNKILLGRVGRLVMRGVAPNVGSFVSLIRNHIISRVKNKTFELHYCLWSNHRKVVTNAPLIST